MAETGNPIPLNDLSRSWIATSAEVTSAVERVLAGGWYIHGPEHKAFEAELASFLGIRHAIGAASGTDALELALQGVGCSAGSEVVTVANAGGYASTAAVRLGCGIAYADVDPTTLLMTPDTLAPALSPSTRAVIVTHLYGNVADVAEIVAICRPRGIPVIEDCAQSLGAVVDGKRVGTFGDVAAISFYPTKNLGAAGDGGAVATDDDEIAASIRSLRQYGWGQKYRIERPAGTNSRLDEIQAAILRVGLSGLDEMTERRQAIIRQYRASLVGSAVQSVSGATSSFVGHLAVVRSGDRQGLRDSLAAAGIQTDIHYPVPDHRQPGLPRPVREVPLPVTERAANEVLTVPCFPELTDAEIERVCHGLSAAGA